jgi:hypothetical protein
VVYRWAGKISQILDPVIGPMTAYFLSSLAIHFVQNPFRHHACDLYTVNVDKCHAPQFKEPKRSVLAQFALEPAAPPSDKTRAK